jgi:hypothetical protein
MFADSLQILEAVGLIIYLWQKCGYLAFPLNGFSNHTNRFHRHDRVAFTCLDRDTPATLWTGSQQQVYCLSKAQAITVRQKKIYLRTCREAGVS